MKTRFTRKDFLKANFAILTAGLVPLTHSALAGPDQEKRPDPLKPELVEAFVRKAHGDLPVTQQMLEETPGLLNATWDWGNGDFETGLGGAGHMGRRDIAEYLLGKGARVDIFVAAMLGKIEVVKSISAAYPDVLQSRGPHGITLLTHAQKGGEQAREVLEFLKSMGLQK